MEGTTPYGSAGLPVQTLRVEVVEGPDAGRSLLAETDVLTIGTGPGNGLVLADPTVSRFHLELTRTSEGVRVRDCGSTNGTMVGSARVDLGVVAPGTLLRAGATALRVGDGKRVEIELHAGSQLGGLRGGTPVMRRLMAQIEKAARADVAVLLGGESGTGKEVIARALHDLGRRAAQPFVTVDCGALTPTLVASEILGHERGAFTGADQRRAGALELAHGGTLFLDEVGELPPAIQTTLLGVLERRRFRRIGGAQEIEVDVRLISATNRDLRSEVNRGSFRLDLFYRIAVVSLSIPPLRERADDIPLLVEHFLREAGHAGPASELISGAAMESLRHHHWPGNVRELRNLIEATLAMGEAPALPDAAGPLEAAAEPIAAVLALPYKEARGALLQEFEGRYLRALLERTAGNVSRAAREARMDRSHLIDLLQRHRIR